MPAMRPNPKNKNKKKKPISKHTLRFQASIKSPVTVKSRAGYALTPASVA